MWIGKNKGSPLHAMVLMILLAVVLSLTYIQA